MNTKSTLLLFSLLASTTLLAKTPVCELKIAATLPHDSRAYTQGLAFQQGVLIESTGLYGRSDLRRVDLLSGRMDDSRPLAKQQFAEGLVGLDDKLYQLTWKSGEVLVYQWPQLIRLASQYIEGEGWGLTRDGDTLIVSNGSPWLTFYEPRQWQIKRRVPVYDLGVVVQRLNELEFIDGKIWANIWHEDRIAVIDPQSGEVEMWLDLKRLREKIPDSARSANGIAFNPQSKRIYLTGKYWPHLFEIKPPMTSSTTCYEKN